MSNPTRSRKTKGIQPRLLHAVVLTLIEQLYGEARTENLKADLRDEGIETIDDAYVKGFHHALAELHMRIEEKRQNG